jgi:hypothetical protein
MSEGLNKNKKITGIHIAGNHGEYDTKGYLHPLAPECSVEQSLLFKSLFTPGVTATNCWRCGAWKQVHVEWSLKE